MSVTPAVPALAGVLDAAAIEQTAASIAAVQHPDGAIPWFDGGHTDPWDHLQCAMALTAAGLHEAAGRAFAWSREAQRPDGSWATKYVGEEITDASTDANFCAYVATAVWHRWLVTGDRSFAESMFPAVRAAMAVVLSMQAPGGEIRWSRNPAGELASEALVTGNASIHHSLRCAAALARLCGRCEPTWELAADRIGHALREHPERFADKSRYSMDWYYPVLGGVVRGEEAAQRVKQRWDDFVVPGLGIRCVDDAPWVTGAETCELVLALHASGQSEAAREQLAAMQHLRTDDGSYWTGLVFTDGQNWPVEKTTWTGATVILAVDALSGSTGGSGLFSGAGRVRSTDAADAVGGAGGAEQIDLSPNDNEMVCCA